VASAIPFYVCSYVLSTVLINEEDMVVSQVPTNVHWICTLYKWIIPSEVGHFAYTDNVEEQKRIRAVVRAAFGCTILSCPPVSFDTFISVLCINKSIIK